MKDSNTLFNEAKEIFSIVDELKLWELVGFTEVEQSVFKLRLIEGKSFIAIGKDLHLESSRCIRIFRRSVKRLREKLQSFAEEYRNAEEYRKEIKQLKDEISSLKKRLGIIESKSKTKESTPIAPELLSMSIHELNLDTRISNTLINNKIKTVGDLIVLEIEDLLRFRNMGLKSITEIETALAKHHLRFGRR